MSILSFDVGIKHLAYCIIDTESRIVEWDILDLNPNNIKKITIGTVTENALIILKNLFDQMDISDVVIENQPVMKNPVMKSIQMIIYTFFMNLKINEKKTISQVKFISAVSKNKYMDRFKDCDECKVEVFRNRYDYNKKMSISVVKHLLKKNSDTELYDYFVAHKKKDDLADAYLQALLYKDTLN